MAKSTRKWFTLVELIIALGLFGVGFIAVFAVMNYGFSTMSQARAQVIAINLAREGAEMVFNLRDTNLRKRSGKKDECRLNTNTPSLATPADSCETSPWLSIHGVPGMPMQLTLYTGGMIAAETGAFFGATPLYTGADIFPDNYIATTTNQYFRMCLQTGSNQRHQCIKNPADFSQCRIPQPDGSRTLEPCVNHAFVSDTQFGAFYRTITSQGLFYKDPTLSGGKLMNCPSGDATDPNTGLLCGGSEPKEFRFCSEVQYTIGKGKRKVTICSLITNFTENDDSSN